MLLIVQAGRVVTEVYDVPNRDDYALLKHSAAVNSEVFTAALNRMLETGRVFEVEAKVLHLPTGE